MPEVELDVIFEFSRQATLNESQSNSLALWDLNRWSATFAPALVLIRHDVLSDLTLNRPGFAGGSNS
jgi:hypothetical protein